MTPDEAEIEANLDRFIAKWNNVPLPGTSEETFKQTENLRMHIRKGCLSRIPPGYGTERNEQIHRILNRSLISGATRITFQLAFALLVCLFYHHSKKMASNLKHKCNSRVQCVPPITTNVCDKSESPIDWHPYKSHRSKVSAGGGKEITESGEDIDDLCSETVAESLIDSAIRTNDIVTSFSRNSVNRSYNSAELLLLADIPNALTFENTYVVDDPTIQEHEDRLRRNLSGFDLEIDEVARDGDCAFRSIVRMLALTYNQSQDKDLIDHLKTLGLLKNETRDVETLRNLFVSEVLKADEDIVGFLTDEEQRSLTEKAEEFRRPGVFDREIGDLVIKVCGQLLKIPIIVVTSSENFHYAPFIPGRTLTSKCIYFAFHYYGAGHYDATRSVKTGT